MNLDYSTLFCPMDCSVKSRGRLSRFLTHLLSFFGSHLIAKDDQGRSAELVIKICELCEEGQPLTAKMGYFAIICPMIAILFLRKQHGPKKSEYSLPSALES